MRKILLMCALFSIFGCNRKLDETDLMSPSVKEEVMGYYDFDGSIISFSLNINENKALKNVRIKTERADTGYFDPNLELFQLDTTISISGLTYNSSFNFTKANNKAGIYKYTVTASDIDGNSTSKSKEFYLPNKLDSEYPYLIFQMDLDTVVNFNSSNFEDVFVYAQGKDFESGVDKYDIDIERPFMNGNVLEMKSVVHVSGSLTSGVFGNYVNKSVTLNKSDFVDNEYVYLAIRLSDKKGNIKKYLSKLRIKF